MVNVKVGRHLIDDLVQAPGHTGVHYHSYPYILGREGFASSKIMEISIFSLKGVTVRLLRIMYNVLINYFPKILNVADSLETRGTVDVF